MSNAELVRETLGGLAGAGPPQRTYLGYLVLQCVAAFIWWPKDTLSQNLAANSEPATLVAVLTFVGISITYYVMRLGAEELMLPGQQSLKQHAATPNANVTTGLLIAFGLQVAHALALSLPIILLAYSVGANDPKILGWGLGAIVALAFFYRFLATAFYLRFGHREALLFIGLRLALIAGYGLSALAAPFMNHLIVTYNLIRGRDEWTLGFAPSHQVFVYGHLLLGLLALMWTAYELRARATEGSDVNDHDAKGNDL
ncbi:MAG: hypothetical protein AAF493_01970 [Pseudomonadota bacterium]